VTPPRLTTSPQAAEIARVTSERLRSLAIDGLVLYDIDDESDRNPGERPFPFLPTMDPADYLASTGRSKSTRRTDSAPAIAERDGRRGDEHLRLIAKQEAGCST
jgi:hypothetical protein